MNAAKSATWVRSLGDVTGAAALVVGLYGLPLALLVVMGQDEADGLLGLHARVDERREVVWQPPEEPVTDDLTDEEPQADPEEAEVAGAEASETSTPTPITTTDPLGNDFLSWSDAELYRPRKKDGPGVRHLRSYTKTQREPTDPAVYISPKGKEKKRCAALRHTIVQLDDHEYMLPREVLHCYLTHWNQFDDMGWVAWADHPERTRKRRDRYLKERIEQPAHIGVEVYPSHHGEDAEVAERLGIERRDILLSAGGVKLKSFGAFAPLALRLRIGGPLKVKLLRDDEPITLTWRIKGKGMTTRSLKRLQELAEEADESEGLAEAGEP